MKIYTKTGDKGKTSLVGGARVSKSDPRLETYGTVDELNSFIGLCIAHAEAEERLSQIIPLLKKVQHKLFNIGSLLACEDEKLRAQLPALEEKDILFLEQSIDQANSSLEPLREFILPGGSVTAARLHAARTLARRAERLIVGFEESHALHPLIVPYINRLSDWLFILARLANQLLGQSDIKWEKES